MDARAKSVIDDWNSKKSSRGTFESHWQQIGERLVPDRADYLAERSPGQKRMTLIYDATPMWALQQGVAGLHSLLTSTALPWFMLRVEDEAVDRMDDVRAWLEAASDHLYTIFNGPKHNFAAQSQELYQDVLSIGTGVMAVLDSVKSDILFSTRHLKECCIGENDDDRVDALVRRWKWTAKQAVQRWGNRAGKRVIEAADKKPDATFQFFHSVKPRSLRDTGRSDARNMAFESLYVGEADGEIISEGGFPEFPYLAPRWTKLTGELYGRGQGMIALPDIKMLYTLVKMTIKSAEKIIDPPLQLPDDGFILPVRTVPGSLNFYRAGSRDRIEPIQTGGNVQLGLEMIDSLRQQILRTFFVDLLRVPTDLSDPGSDGKGSTATYWNQRREKEMMALSPMIARMQSEFLDPLIKRTFAMQWRRSAARRFGPGSPFPPPPDAVMSSRLVVEYVSPMVLAQKSTQIDAIDRLIEKNLQLRQLDQSVPIVVDAEAIMRLTSRDLNAPNVALKSAETMAAEAQAAAQERQEMQQQAAMANTAGAAKDATGAIKNVADAAATAGGGEDLQEAA